MVFVPETPVSLTSTRLNNAFQTGQRKQKCNQSPEPTGNLHNISTKDVYNKPIFLVIFENKPILFVTSNIKEQVFSSNNVVIIKMDLFEFLSCGSIVNAQTHFCVISILF